MGSVITVVLVAMIGLWFVVKIARMFSIAGEKHQAHNRCAFCRSRLRKTVDRMSYASVCSRCGKTQPWAAEPPGS